MISWGGCWSASRISGECSATRIAEEDEPHRLKGEPLSPRFSLESRLEHKERIGEYLWSALFQQKPVAESGNLLKRTSGVTGSIPG